MHLYYRWIWQHGGCSHTLTLNSLFHSDHVSKTMHADIRMRSFKQQIIHSENKFHFWTWEIERGPDLGDLIAGPALMFILTHIRLLVLKWLAGIKNFNIPFRIFHNSVTIRPCRRLVSGSVSNLNVVPLSLSRCAWRWCRVYGCICWTLTEL